MKSIKDLFSLRRHKSDNDIEKPRRAFSAGNLTNFRNFFLKKSKSVTLLQSNEDEAKTHETLKLHTNSEFVRSKEPPVLQRRKSLKRRRNDNHHDKTTKKVKHNCEQFEHLNLDDQNDIINVTINVKINEKVGLEINPKWTFSSGQIDSYYIANISPNSAAARNESLQVGDEIIKINGRNLSEYSHFFAQNFMVQQEELIDLTISRRRKRTNLPEPVLTGMKKFTDIEAASTPKYSERYCSLSGQLQISVQFYKGANRRSLGFSIVGGKDSSKGNLGIYIKRIFEDGQAAELGILQEADEIVSVNGIKMNGLTHLEALQTFRNVKSGFIFMEVVRKSESYKFRHSF